MSRTSQLLSEAFLPIEHVESVEGTEVKRAHTDGSSHFSSTLPNSRILSQQNSHLELDICKPPSVVSESSMKIEAALS